MVRDPICLDNAVAAVRELPPDQQGLVAAQVMQRARALSDGPTKFLAEDHALLEIELAAARRGELTSDQEVASGFAKYGL